MGDKQVYTPERVSCGREGGMTEKEKTRLNKIIARELGFYAYGKMGHRCYDPRAWHYPSSWYEQQAGMPENLLPDFMGAVENMMVITEMCGISNIIHKDFNSYPTEEDLQHDQANES